MGENIGKIFKIETTSAASGTMKGSNFTRQLTYGAETTSANGWPDGRHSIGAGSDGRYFSGEAGGSGRAYIGLGEFGLAGAEIADEVNTRGLIHKAADEGST